MSFDLLYVDGESSDIDREKLCLFQSLDYSWYLSLINYNRQCRYCHNIQHIKTDFIRFISRTTRPHYLGHPPCTSFTFSRVNTKEHRFLA